MLTTTGGTTMTILIRKLKHKEMFEIIKVVADPSMTRMEAWEAVKAAGATVKWETFKCLAREAKICFRKS